MDKNNYGGEEVGASVAYGEDITVHYCIPEEAIKYQVGLALDSRGKTILIDLEGKPITLTRNSAGTPATVEIRDYDPDNAIYVMDPQGNIYMAKKAKNFQHSSFVGGKDIAAAGELLVENGKIIAINNKSGHYMPFALGAVQFLRRLQQLGIDISEIQVRHSVLGRSFDGREYIEISGYRR